MQAGLLLQEKWTSKGREGKLPHKEACRLKINHLKEKKLSIT
jgi:hypothetical protein